MWCIIRTVVTQKRQKKENIMLKFFQGLAFGIVCFTLPLIVYAHMTGMFQMDFTLINKYFMPVFTTVGFTAFFALLCYQQFSWFRLFLTTTPSLFWGSLLLLVEYGTELQLWIVAGILAAFMVIMIVGCTAVGLFMYFTKKENV